MNEDRVGKTELHIPHIFHLNDSSHKHRKHDSQQTPNKQSLLPALRSIFTSLQTLFFMFNYLLHIRATRKSFISQKLILDLAVSEISLNYNYPASKFPTRQTVFDNETMARSFHRDGKPARTNFWTLPPSLTSHWFIQSHQIIIKNIYINVNININEKNFDALFTF